MANKRIISYCLWGSDARYNEGAVENVALAQKYYPGWTCRIYCDPEAPAYERLQEMACETVPMPESGWFGLFWRFLAATDPATDYILFRDADSRLGLREARAVEEWIASGASVHSMHDHSEHLSLPLLAGLWGIRGGRVPELGLLAAEWSRCRELAFGDDQRFLNDLIWPRFLDDHLGHVCKELLDAVPVHAWGGHFRAFSDDCRDGAFVGRKVDVARPEPVDQARGRTRANLRELEVFYVFPSCNPSRAARACEEWRSQGYRTAVLLDYGLPSVGADIELYESPYEGYYRSANKLCQLAIIRGADVVVMGGDDLSPDPSRLAQAIAEEFFLRFPDGMGVLQPTGDDLPGTDQICGSPWLGRSFVQRFFQGRGPYCPEYGHFFGDQELFETARQLDVLWQRRDVAQRHDHWTRAGAGEQTDYQRRNTRLHWQRDKEIFEARRAAGFPGHSPLPGQEPRDLQPLLAAIGDGSGRA